MSVIEKLGGGHRQPAGCKEGSGILLMVLGGIVMLGSGLCTVVLGIGSPENIGIFLVYGGIPFLVAGGVYWLGNWIRKNAQRPGGEPGPNEPPSSAG